MPLTHIKCSERTMVSIFRNDSGCDEYYVLTRSKMEDTFQASLANVLRDYRKVMERFGIRKETLVFSRFILSDIENMKGDLRASELFALCQERAYSIIGQPPGFPGGGIYFLAYHVAGAEAIEQESGLAPDTAQNAVTVRGRNYDMLFSGAFTGKAPLASATQTDEVFDAYNGLLNRKNLTLFDDCVRTWIYCRDIDNHYAGMVKARKAMFEREGLLPNTHYIASTGIEAKGIDPHVLITMDALSYRGLTREQIVQLEAPEHMGPTHMYGVTFERGTLLRFGDRSHYHISGTASINPAGDVLFPTDVRKQTVRALDNIEALLAPKGASLRDMAYLIVYLRNPSELRKVQEALHQRVPVEIPTLFVEGSVCRPTWLVEVEGVAITDQAGPFPPFL